jgi:hypothetical protein
MMAYHLHQELTRQPFPGVSPWFMYGAVSDEGTLIAPFQKKINVFGLK